VLNLAPARLTGALAAACAPAGSRGRAWRVLRTDGATHPSPNAGRCEAAFAGALGVRLGGRNVYAGRVEDRPVMGAAGRPCAGGDVPAAVRLSRRVETAAVVLAVGAAMARPW
jgi:adenosylcobinamide-phosphate synthase